MRTRINAKWVVGFQGGGHRLHQDGCVVIEGRDVVFAGTGYTGKVDQVIELPESLLGPGFIDTHVHCG